MVDSTFMPGDAVTITDERLVFASRTGEVVAVDRESGDVTVAVPRHAEIEGSHWGTARRRDARLPGEDQRAGA